MGLLSVGFGVFEDDDDDDDTMDFYVGDVAWMMMMTDPWISTPGG